MKGTAKNSELLPDSSTKRLNWVDWMKVIAMYFIIAGHCWVPYNEYIYIFSVPCFFIISGFLSHKQQSHSVFWKKLFWNMVIPMMLFLIVNLAFYDLQMFVNGQFDISFLWKGPLLSLAGMQGQDYLAGGLKAMWFVYTLCLCKIIIQYLPKKFESLLLVALSIVFCIIAWIMNMRGLEIRNAVVNLFLAFPFFCFGYVLRPLLDKLNSLSVGKSSLLFAVCAVLSYLCGKYNGMVFLYRCSYGNNLLLCLLGGISGTCLVYIASVVLDKLFSGLNINIFGGVRWLCLDCIQ